jgi:WD40 repeat protein
MKAFITLLIFSVLSVSVAIAQEKTPEFVKACPYTDSPNYRVNQAVTVRDKQLLLIDTATGEVLQILDSGYESYFPFNIFWTENCRYVIALNVWMLNDLYEYPIRFSSLYDTFTGKMLDRWRRDEFFALRYSPTKEHFIMKRIDGTFLMSETMSKPVLMFKHVPVRRSLHRYEWDLGQGELLVVFRQNTGYLFIYNIQTGEQRAVISQPEGCTVPLTFDLIDEMILIYTQAGKSANPACISVYNRETGTMQTVEAGELSTEERDRLALSPDKRYLVSGFRALRVWDLANTLSVEPLYRHEGPLGIITSVRFVGDRVIETVSVDGVQQWDILTGQEIIE